MNGDIGKLPPGAVYPATPEPLGSVGGTVIANTSLDYSVMNGGSVPGELMLDPTTMGGIEPSPQHSIRLSGTVGGLAGSADIAGGTSDGGGGGNPPSIAGAAPPDVAGALRVGVNLGYVPVEVNPLDVQMSPALMTDLPTSGIPLDQLKQMLSSQLEYYFSRYVIFYFDVFFF